MTGPFPLGVWGRVARPPIDDPDVSAVRIDDAGPSFIICTRGPAGEYDTWVETRRDVLDYLTTMAVDWPSGD